MGWTIWILVHMCHVYWSKICDTIYKNKCGVHTPDRLSQNTKKGKIFQSSFHIAWSFVTMFSYITSCENLIQDYFCLLFLIIIIFLESRLMFSCVAYLISYSIFLLNSEVCPSGCRAEERRVDFRPLIPTSSAAYSSIYQSCLLQQASIQRR